MTRRAAVCTLALVLAFAACRFGWQIGTMMRGDWEVRQWHAR